MHIVSDYKIIYQFSKDLSERQILFQNELKNEVRIVEFNNHLCAYFQDSEQVLIFKGLEKLDPLEIPQIVGEVHTICSTEVLLISGSSGFVIYGKDFKQLCLMTLNYQKMTEVLFVERNNDKLTFGFKDQNMMKIFTTLHSKPREYQIPEKIKEQLKNKITKLEISGSGNYISASNKDAICIYNCVEGEITYKYEKKNGDKNLYNTGPQFISDRLVVFTTGRIAITYDLKNKKEIH